VAVGAVAVEAGVAAVEAGAVDEEAGAVDEEDGDAEVKWTELDQKPSEIPLDWLSLWITADWFINNSLFLPI